MNSEFLGYELYCICETVIKFLPGGKEGLPLVCVKAIHVALLEKVKVEIYMQLFREDVRFPKSECVRKFKYVSNPCDIGLPNFNLMVLQKKCYDLSSIVFSCVNRA